ncbi:MAG: Holliday junction resolvase RuvX [Candidatus Eisenbacteria bacterium]
MKRILAADWGTRRVGLALSDALGITAQPLPPLLLPDGQDPAHAPAYVARALAALAAELEAARIVLGLPLELSGERGEAARAADALAAALAPRTGVPVELWDERFTSALAEQSIREEGRTLARRKGGGRERARATSSDKARVDQRAALLLLQSWLDAHPDARGGEFEP